MRVFVTGASGWIGSAVVPELLGAGHQVLGLARSDSSAAAITTAGAEVLRGDLDDLDALDAGQGRSSTVFDPHPEGTERTVLDPAAPAPGAASIPRTWSNVL